MLGGGLVKSGDGVFNSEKKFCGLGLEEDSFLREKLAVGSVRKPKSTHSNI